MTDTASPLDSLRLSIESVEDYAIVMLDPAGRIQSWNTGARRITQYSESEIVGRDFGTFYLPEDRAAGVPEALLEVALAQGHMTTEGWRVRRDGSRYWASVSLAAVRDADGTLRGFAKVTRDLTERRAAEQRLLEQQGLLRLLNAALAAVNAAHTARDAVEPVLREVCAHSRWDAGSLRVLDASGQPTDVVWWHGDGAERMLAGAAPPGRSVRVRVWKTLRADAGFDRAAAAAAAGFQSAVAIPVLVRDRLVAMLEFFSRTPGMPEGEWLAIAGALGAAIGRAFERAEARETEERFGRELQALSHRLLEVQEEERARIARELHDQLGQVLTAVKLNLEAASRASYGRAVGDSLRESTAVVEAAIRQVRDLAYGLRPAMLDDLGLAAALSSFARQAQERSGTRITVNVDGVGRGISPRIDLACFRIVQEAVLNALRHAAATRVDVRVQVEPDGLAVQVEDNGVGFDPDLVLRGGRHGALGLTGMRERAELVGGRLRFEAAPGAGTVVDAALPLTGARSA